MIDYKELAAILIGIIITIIFKRKDIAEILKMWKEINKIDKEIHPTA